MEIIALLFIALVGLVVLKIFAGIFNLALFAVALPFKILAFGFATLLVVFVLIPVGLVAAVAGLLVAPIALLFALAPFLLIALGVYFVVKNV